MAKTSMNMEENVASALCYVLMWVTGLVFFLMEKENKTVRFHAMQSILTFLPLTILGSIFQFVGATTSVIYTETIYGNIPSGVSQPFIFLMYIAWILYVLMFIVWLVLLIKAYQGEKFKLPVIGDIAEKNS